jgi:hypothetical protein
MGPAWIAGFKSRASDRNQMAASNNNGRNVPTEQIVCSSNVHHIQTARRQQSGPAPFGYFLAIYNSANTTIKPCD